MTRNPLLVTLTSVLCVALAGCSGEGGENPAPNGSAAPSATGASPTSSAVPSSPSSATSGPSATSATPTAPPALWTEGPVSPPSGETASPAAAAFWFVSLPSGYTAVEGEMNDGWRLHARSDNGCSVLDWTASSTNNPGDLRAASESRLERFASADGTTPGAIEEVNFWTGPEAEGGQPVPFVAATWSVPSGAEVWTAVRTFAFSDFFAGQSFETIALQLRCPADSLDASAWDSLLTTVRPTNTGDLTNPWGQ